MAPSIDVVSFRISTETVFNIVIQDEIQLLRREPVVPCQHRIDFIEDGLGLSDAEFVVGDLISIFRVDGLLLCVALEVTHEFSTERYERLVFERRGRHREASRERFADMEAITISYKKGVKESAVKNSARYSRIPFILEIKVAPVRRRTDSAILCVMGQAHGCLNPILRRLLVEDKVLGCSRARCQTKRTIGLCENFQIHRDLQL